MICTHCAEARENCYYFEIEYQSYFFPSSFPLLSFVPDCIPWAESFPYENHHSQARTSLQVARGKNEAFFLTFFLFSRWWSFATFAKKQVTGWPDRFLISYSFRIFLRQKKFCDLQNGGRSQFFICFFEDEGSETTIRLVLLITVLILFCLRKVFSDDENQS